MKSLFSTKVIVSTNHLLFTIILLPWLLPYYITQAVLPEYLVLVLQVVSVALMMIYIVNNRWYLSNTKIPLVLLGIIYLSLMVSTLNNNGAVWTALTVVLSTILMSMVVIIVALKEDNTPWQFTAVGKYICLFFLIINIYIMFRYPGGIPSYSEGKRYPYFLYGSMNTMIKFILPGMCCSSLIDKKNEKLSIGTLLFWFAIIYQFFAIYRTATTIVALIFITLWIFVEKIFKNRVRSIYLGSIITIAVFEVLIVLISNTNFKDFITNLFNKSTDFTGRFILWQRTITLIKEEVVWGHGLQLANSLKHFIGNTSGSHNYYLDLVYQCGLFGMSFFLILILLPLARIKKSEVSDSLYIVIGYAIGTLLMFLTEPYVGHDIRYFPVFFAVIALCYGRNEDSSDVA